MNAPQSLLDGKVILHPGDCLDVLKTLAANSVDSIVTDPPYGLDFMGKGWDGADGFRRSLNKTDAGRDSVFGLSSRRGPEYKAGTLFQEFMYAVATECRRVLKPGGHLAAFGGTRTYHRMAVAIEDAGFEIRDSLINIVDPTDPIVAFMQSLNETQLGAFLRCIDDSQFGGMLAWLYGTGFPKSHDVSKGIDGAAGFERDRPRHEGTPFGGKGRQICSWCGKSKGGGTGNCKCEKNGRAATDAAREWEGWGTALKPAFEPIVLARKPLIGTVAENVLKHGTGALNIDGCRVATSDALGGGGNTTPISDGWDRPYRHDPDAIEKHKRLTAEKVATAESLGRWPANVIHDGSDEVVGAFPHTASRQDISVKKSSAAESNGNRGAAYGGESRAAGSVMTSYGDEGSAARFFYTAKADADDRLGSKHPTVKPPDLMRWLVRLVTPPGGLVLDPFAGTGTTGEAAFREGMLAVLIEREPEYQNDIRRRMAHALAGPKERKRTIAKEHHKDKPHDAGPLFAGSETPPAGAEGFTESSRTKNRPGRTEAVNP